MRVTRLVAVLFGALLLATSVAADEAPPGPDALKAVYDYDISAALDVEVISVEEAAIFTVEKLRFSGMHGERVPATLILPGGTERPPCVLFLHGLGGDRGQAQLVATLLIPQGIAVLAIDAAMHGDRAVAGVNFADVGAELAALDGPLVQTVVDNRRAIDYIESREDIDADRIVLIGASMGGILGSIVAAVDERIDAALLLVAGGGWAAILNESDHPAAERLRASGMGEAEALAYVEPTHFIGHLSPRPLLMINGTEDQIIPRSSAEALYEAAGEPKQIRWYEGGHTDVPVTEVLFLVGWVAEQAAREVEATEAVP